MSPQPIPAEMPITDVIPRYFGNQVLIEHVCRVYFIDCLMEASTSEIFVNHSIDEVRHICVDIRNNVENRRVELRFLVGERHRDVIEASDNILSMKRHSDHVGALRGFSLRLDLDCARTG